MVMGEGWWIDTRTGEMLQIYEHFDAVINEPERFGIEPERVKGKAGDQQARQDILTDVIKNGWMRVRLHAGGVVFEYYGNPEAAARAAIPLVKSIAGPFTRVHFKNVETGRGGIASAEDILSEEGWKIFASIHRDDYWKDGLTAKNTKKAFRRFQGAPVFGTLDRYTERTPS